MKTKVLFLFEKVGNDVFAFFPEMPHSFNGYRPDNMTCYAHVGQHSACHPDYAKECKEADFGSYNELKIELEGIGYKLDVQNKDFVRQDAIKKGKVWVVRYEHDREKDLFEGTKTQCQNFIKVNRLQQSIKRGHIRLGQVISELTPQEISN